MQDSLSFALGEDTNKLLDASLAAFWEWDLNTGTIQLSDSGFTILGYDCNRCHSLSESKWKSVCHPGDLVEAEQKLKEYIEGRLDYYRYTIRVRHAGGGWRWLSTRGQWSQPPTGSVRTIRGAFFDVSDGYPPHYYLDQLAKAIPGVIYSLEMKPDGSLRFPYISPKVKEFFGIPVDEALTDPKKVFERIVPEDIDRIMHSITESYQHLTVWREDYRVVLNGELRWIRGESVPKRKSGGIVVWHGMVVDITSQKSMEAELQRLSVTDDLTGLHNRRFAIEKISDLVAHSKRYGSKFSIVSLDVDHFKQVNDQHGHLVGDQVLKRLGRFLSNSLRQSDTGARMGGEEFLLALPDTEMNGALLLTTDIIQRFAKEPFQGTDREPFTLTLSAGVAQWGPEYNGTIALLRACDRALYQSKQDGRNRVSVAIEK